MKKLILFWLIATVIVSCFVGCSKQAATPTDVTTTAVSNEQPVSTPSAQETASLDSAPAESSTDEESTTETQSTVSNIPSQPAESVVTSQPLEDKIICDATLEDDFATDTVVVVMQKAYSEVNKVWSVSDFPELTNIISISDLTYTEVQQAIDRRKKDPDFQQILSFTLSTTTKQDILDSIKALEKNPMILSVEPNGYMQID